MTKCIMLRETIYPADTKLSWEYAYQQHDAIGEPQTSRYPYCGLSELGVCYMS